MPIDALVLNQPAWPGRNGATPMGRKSNAKWMTRVARYRALTVRGRVVLAADDLSRRMRRRRPITWQRALAATR